MRISEGRDEKENKAKLCCKKMKQIQSKSQKRSMSGNADGGMSFCHVGTFSSTVFTMPALQSQYLTIGKTWELVGMWCRINWSMHYLALTEHLLQVAAEGQIGLVEAIPLL
jgi:hypothetical protein